MKGERVDRTAERAKTGARVLAAVIVVGAIAVAATTGDSWAVRSILVLVAGDVAVRLWRW
jgi:Na+/H+ antiporter NhaC